MAFVFLSANGKWISRQNWQRRGFEVACIKAKLVEIVGEGDDQTQIAKYRQYGLHHFFASMHIERRTNLKKLQTLIRHSLFLHNFRSDSAGKLVANPMPRKKAIALLIIQPSAHFRVSVFPVGFAIIGRCNAL
jgi:hypothetical protein